MLEVRGLAFSLLVLLTACSASFSYETFLTDLLGAEQVSDIRGVNNGFEDTFHYVRFVTDAKVINAFVRANAMTESDSFGPAVLEDWGLLHPPREVRWWRPEEVAGGQVYYEEFLTERQGEQVLSHSYHLAFSPDTGVAYLVVFYP